MITFGAWISHEEYGVDDPRVDYSEYLGPNWKQELKDHMAKAEPDTMIISNHNGLFENIAHLTSKAFPSFTASV